MWIKELNEHASCHVDGYLKAKQGESKVSKSKQQKKNQEPRRRIDPTWQTSEGITADDINANRKHPHRIMHAASEVSGNYPRVSSSGEYEAWQIGHLYRRYSNQDFRQSRWKACLQRFSTRTSLSGGECCAPQLQRGSGRVVGL